MKSQLCSAFQQTMLYLGNAESIGKLFDKKHFYFVPMKQDNPITKPRSVVFIPEFIKKTLEEALDNKQIQPMILGV